ncbi:metal-sensitive transcriptional regulator [Pseudogulbenkiania subflava]|uniref:DNA-binding transcriptional regulator, FrmR family n=1 Tax=Pseudogulbenkiania subflava DSM 22618 TaxID=1123014 RepID=A0A1Y6B858_9NEIS|nr:metal-sensitive transcriptional regulator [Pseudogulbenkiania subflava]SME97879.1 DNA-binding transcriptional regulator, FrmR family [Pseudogulbenkiania subflava DSM 22618]
MQQCCDQESPGSDKLVVQPNKSALLKRLARIEGQVRGISGMIEGDRYCVDVLTQIAAVKSALDAVSLQLLENHMKGCVAQALRAGDATGVVTELIDVVKKVR